VAISEFALDGDDASAAMTWQLQDGFVLGLVRGGIDVLDAEDVAKKLAEAPELEKCETSPCLKRLGEALAVPFVIRVRISVAGNSYKMTARLFSTEGIAPAALPLAAQSRPCDVCTVAEAREQMIRLADSVRHPIEEIYGPPPRPPASPAPRSLVAPLAGVAASVTAVVAGTILLISAAQNDRRQTAIGAGLIGAGLATTTVSLYFTFRSGPDGPAAIAGVRGAMRF
jgi:hypothetical protein